MKAIKKYINILLLISASFLYAQSDGKLDRSFNMCGKVETVFGVDSMAKATAIQSDGKIVVAGYTDVSGQNTFALARYNDDGSLDSSFGNNGLVITRFGAGEKASGAHAIAIQTDGKIIAGGFTNVIRGHFRWCLARYNEDGSLDNSFFGGRGIIPGTVINTFDGNDIASQVNSIALQSDGKIVAAGFSVAKDAVLFAVARYNANGSLDTSFNEKGNGSIAGTVRTDFGSMGIKDDQANAVCIARDGKIVVGGSSYVTGVKTFALARYLSDGNLDTSFFSHGYAKVHGTIVTSFAAGETEGAIKALVIQPDEKIVAAGYTNSCAMPCDSSRFALARYEKCGRLDKTFGGNGFASVPGTVISSFGAQEQSSQANALVLQADGKLVAAGFSRMADRSIFALARYTQNGDLDFNFNNKDSAAGIVLTKFSDSIDDEIFGLAIQADGSLVAVGKSANNLRPHFALTRYACIDSDLMLPTFTNPANGARIINGSAVQLKGMAQNPGIINIYCNDKFMGSTCTNASCKKWNYTLPPMASGEYTFHALQLYPSGNVNLRSSDYKIIIDQHPRAIYASDACICAKNALTGKLKADGASGNYSYKVLWASSGSVTLDGDTYTFIPNVSSGVGTFEFEVTDNETQCSSIARVVVTIHPIPVAQNSEYVIFQDTVLTGNIAECVSSGLPPYRFQLVDSDENGTIYLNADGSFTFIPIQGFSGQVRFKYRVIDQRQASSETKTITINVYQKPQIESGVFAVCQDSELLGNLNNLVYGGTPPYEFILVDNSAQNGRVVILPDGSFICMPASGFSGTAQFAFNVVDAHQGKSNNAVVMVTVSERPVVATAAFSTSENIVINNTLAGLASKGNPPYTFAPVNDAVNGSVILNADGSFTFTPNQDFFGTATFQYQVIDSIQCASDPATVSIGVEKRPVLNNAHMNICQNSALSAHLIHLVSSGAAPFTFSSDSRANNGSVVINPDGSFIFTPDADFSGQASFSYGVIDGHGAWHKDVGTVTVTVLEKPVAFNYEKTIHQSEAIVSHLCNLVSKGTPPYTFEQIGKANNGSLVLKENGTFRFEPAEGFVGVANFQYKVADANKLQSEIATAQITIISDPSASNITQNISQDTVLNGNLSAAVTGGIPPYTFNLVDTGVNGIAQVNGDGSFSFTPTAGFVGVAHFNYQATDALAGKSAISSVEIVVYQTPFAADSVQSIYQGAVLSGNLNDSISFGMQPYIFSQIGQSDNGSAVINADGSFNFIPVTGFAGDALFNYRVIDALGAFSNIAQKTISVYELPIVSVYTATICQDTVLNGDLMNLANKGLPPYRFAQVGDAINGVAVINADGSFNFSPVAGFSGRASFQYAITDANNITSQPAIALITVNQVPVAAQSEQSVCQDATLNGNLADLIVGGVAPYVFAQIGQANNGSVLINADGSYVFNPDAGFNGNASFQYKVTDANQYVSNRATVSITVNPKPIAMDSAKAICQDKTLVGNLAELIAVGTPPYHFLQVGQATNGTAIVNADGTFSFAPDSNCAGTETFQYCFTDGNGYQSSIATMAVTVLEQPKAADAQQTIFQNKFHWGNLASLVSGGTPPYTFTTIGDAINGSVSLKTGGSYKFKSSSEFYGQASFSYAVTDVRENMSNVATVTFIVQPKPVAVDVATKVCKNGTIGGNLAELIAIGTPPYQFQQVDNSVNGTAVVNADGTYEFIPDFDFIGAAYFSYTITDANNYVSNSGRVSVQVSEAPRLANAAFQIVQDESLLSHLIGLIQGGSAPFAFSVVDQPVNGNVILNADGSFNFIPNAGFYGDASFQLNVTDANQCKSNTATVSIMVYQKQD